MNFRLGPLISTVRQLLARADWKVGTETILTTLWYSRRAYCNLSALIYPKLSFQRICIQRRNGKIVMQAYPAPSHNYGAYAFVNGLVIEQSLWAFDPTPDKGAKDQAPTQPSNGNRSGSNDFSMPNPKSEHTICIFPTGPFFCRSQSDLDFGRSPCLQSVRTAR